MHKKLILIAQFNCNGVRWEKKAKEIRILGEIDC